MRDLSFEAVTDVTGIALLVVTVVLLAAVDLVPATHPRHRTMRITATLAFAALVAVIAWRFVELAR